MATRLVPILLLLLLLAVPAQARRSLKKKPDPDVPPPPLGYQTPIPDPCPQFTESSEEKDMELLKAAVFIAAGKRRAVDIQFVCL